VAEGGVAVALAESALASGLGATVTGLTDEAELFGEGPGAFLVSGDAEALRAFGTAARVIGEVGGDALSLDGVLSVPLVDLERAHSGGLAELLR
jgi:phosphoribosylformylglycinamidine synthase